MPFLTPHKWGFILRLSASPRTEIPVAAWNGLLSLDSLFRRPPYAAQPMLNLGDVLKVSLVVGWPSALDVEAASVWKQSNPFLGDRSHKAQPQMCVEGSALVNFGLDVDFKEVGPVPWTLGVSHARRVLSHCGSQPAAKNQGLKQTSESRPLAHVVGLRRCFEVRLGPIVRARPQTSRESTELSAWITMLFVQTFRAVELPVRACHKIKHEHSSAAWEARRRHNPPRARA